MRDATNRVLREDHEWRKAVEALLGDADLISVSRHIGDSRAYRQDGQVAIIRHRDAYVPKGVHGLQHEAEVLARLGVRVDYREHEDWQAIVIPRIAGATLEQLLPTLSLPRRAVLLARLIPTLRALHRAGVAHRDLRPDNVIVQHGQPPALVDFDRALMGSPRQAALADWVGVARDNLSYNPYWKFASYTLLPKLPSIASRLRASLRSSAQSLPSCGGDPELERLREAWSLAQTSAANAPGQGVAYYAFTYRHVHFPGERPWYLRWNAIQRAVDLRGKSILELGCNMGLLSTFALIHGARDATGVDADPAIIRAASLVAEVLDSPAQFHRVDLTEDRWEEALAGRDLVVAMSLLQWLPDPERLLRFLGRHREVIFEGHDALEVERERLRSIGFDLVDVVQQTERGRFVLHGRKSQDASTT